MILNCVVIDDEFLARQYLKDYIARVPFLNLIGDYDSPLLIIEELKKGNIDIIFLDIQMPDISGLDFLGSLNPQPLIIFTTAYSEFALEGYEHNTVDYLLKPVSFERFLKAVNKTVNLASGLSKGIKTSETETRAEKKKWNNYLTIRADRKLYKINYPDIIFIEGQKAYVTFHTRDRKITALIAMKDLEESLPHDMFIRIHKSYIVAIKFLESLEGNVVTVGGNKIPVGRNYRDRIESIFRIK